MNTVVLLVLALVHGEQSLVTTEFPNREMCLTVGQQLIRQQDDKNIEIEVVKCLDERDPI